VVVDDLPRSPVMGRGGRLVTAHVFFLVGRARWAFAVAMSRSAGRGCCSCGLRAFDDGHQLLHAIVDEVPSHLAGQRHTRHDQSGCLLRGHIGCV
jgi:hypothetical protein